MAEVNINKAGGKVHILIAPLDWGLGHATRCIPLIKILLQNNAEVFIGAEGAIAVLYKLEFPALLIIPMNGYRVRYSRNTKLFFFKMLKQLPGIISTIRNENRWLKKIVKEHKIDMVISDNRFGLYHKTVPSIYITHQLFIETGNSFLNRIAQKINYHYINKFTECWVPDAPGKINLAGKLSHPEKLPVIPVKYLGILSRFKKIFAEKKYGLLILLSGPEPQRTIFENILLEQIGHLSCSIAMVRGLPGISTTLPGAKNLTAFNHLPADELNELILQSDVLIARCGYSTIMDLGALGKTAILVPTPAQAEQEWLAAYLSKNKIFYTVPQQNFSLSKSLKEAENFQYGDLQSFEQKTEKIITEFLERIVIKA